MKSHPQYVQSSSQRYGLTMDSSTQTWSASLPGLFLSGPWLLLGDLQPVPGVFL